MTARRTLEVSLEQECHHWCQMMAGAIIRVRKERRWSQRKLGGVVGLTQKQISVLESDPDAMHVGRLYGTLRALGIDLVMQPAEAAHLPLFCRTGADDDAANDKCKPLVPPV